MTKKEYEYQCLLRRPAFVRDLNNHYRQHPLAVGYFASAGFEAPFVPAGCDPEAFEAKVAAVRACFLRHLGAAGNLCGLHGRGWLDEIARTRVDKATGERFTDTEVEILREYREDSEAQRAFRVRYPLWNDLDSLSMVRQPFPLAFDPAWKVCADQAVIEFLSAHGGRAPIGMVTRAAVDSVGRAESREAADVYQRARRLFTEQSVESRRLVRQNYAPAIFESGRVFVLIGPATTREQVSRMWPIVEHAKRAAYGRLGKNRKRAPRRNFYDEQISIYDLVKYTEITVQQAAQRLRRPARTVLRRLRGALRDIEGEAALRRSRRWSWEKFREHTARCQTCSRAKTSDKYCKTAQRQLGPRSWWVPKRRSLSD